MFLPLFATAIAALALVGCSDIDLADKPEGQIFVQPVSKAAGGGAANSDALVNVLAYHWKGHTVLDNVEVNLETPEGVKSSGKGYASLLLPVGSYRVTVSAPATGIERETSIDLKDALATLQLAIGVERINGTDPGGKPIETSAYQRAAADFNGDGKVDLKDALEILKYSIAAPTTSSPRWHYFHDLESIAQGSPPKSELTTESREVSVIGTTSIGIAAVLVGDVDGSWKPSQSAPKVATSYYADLLASLNSTDKTAGLARWGLSDTSNSGTGTVLYRSYFEGVETITYSDGSQIKLGATSILPVVSSDGLKNGFKYLFINDGIGGDVRYTLSGTVSGLDTGKKIILINRIGNETITLSTNGKFLLSNPLAKGGAYSLEVRSQPTAQECVITNASGSGIEANVSNLQITCSTVTAPPQMTVLVGETSSVPGLERDVGQRAIRLVPFSNGRLAITFARGYSLNCQLFNPGTCFENTTTWHAIIDKSGLVVVPQRTWPELDNDTQINNASIAPGIGRPYGADASAIFAMNHSGHNSNGGNFVKISPDGSVVSRQRGNGSYLSEVCVLSQDLLVSSLYVDPVTNAVQWWNQTSSLSGSLNLGGYGFNYPALQNLGCGVSQALGGNYGLIVRKRPGVGIGFTLYSAPNPIWTKVGSEVILPTNLSSGQYLYGGGLETGDDTGVIMFRDVAPDGRRNMFYSRFRLTSAGIQLVDSRPKQIVSSLSTEGLDGAITYGGNGKYYLAVYQAGDSGQGQTINRKQTVQAFSLDFFSNELRTLGDSYQDSNWTGAAIKDVNGNYTNVESFSVAKSCDGNLYIGGSIDGGSGRTVLRIFKVTNLDYSSITCR